MSAYRTLRRIAFGATINHIVPAGVVGVSLLVAAPASADGLLPGFGTDVLSARPSYRESYNDDDVPRRDTFGLPIAAPLPVERPSYRESYNAFPPAEGRYGGGFIEYVLTGGRSPSGVGLPGLAPATTYAEPLAPADYSGIAPQPVAIANPVRASLPRGGLPEYSAQAMGGDPTALPAGSGVSSTGLPQPGLPQLFPQGLFGGIGLGSAAPDRMASTSYNEPGSPYEPGTVGAPGPGGAINPVYNRQTVAYSGRERAGTVVIDTPQKFLYLVEGNGQAIRYGIGVGRPGFTWAGVKSITRKAEWPGWTPPSEMMKRRPDLPRHMEGGIGNPLGARALYLGSSMYRIHGTNEPYSIGTNVSSGCIRMMNQDVIDLYGRVGVGTRVVVM